MRRHRHEVWRLALPAGAAALPTTSSHAGASSGAPRPSPARRRRTRDALRQHVQPVLALAAAHQLAHLAHTRTHTHTPRGAAEGGMA